MLYRFNGGKIRSTLTGLGRSVTPIAMPKPGTYTAAELARQAAEQSSQALKIQAAAKARMAALKVMSFAELDAKWQRENKWYREEFAATVPYELREKYWIAKGKPTAAVQMEEFRRKRLVTGKDIVKDWSKTEDKLEAAQRYVQAAAQAVQAVQASNPQIPQSALVASAASVVSSAVSGSGGGMQRSSQAPEAAPAVQEASQVSHPEAAASGVGTGLTAAGLVGAGLYLLFGI